MSAQELLPYCNNSAPPLLDIIQSIPQHNDLAHHLLIHPRNLITEGVDADMNDFDSIAQSLEPGDRDAIILLEVPGDEENVERAIRIAGSGGGSDWERLRLTECLPAIILIRMDPARAKVAVIRLIENGFSKLVAIYPKPGPGTRPAP